MAAKGNAEWRGDLKGGSGTFTAGDGGIAGDFSFRSRFEDGPGANPEQLIAAAHASCFSMALSNMLAKAGSPPQALDTSADVMFQPGEGITGIHLSVVGSVEGMSAEDFASHAENAKQNCPVSQALTGTTITLDAKLG
jgi:osmotically inducible protein OsmC